MYYIYLLLSLKDNGFYTGFTSDLRLRYIQHQEGLVTSTKYRRPLELIYYEAYKSKNKAQDRENKLKQYGAAYNELLKRLGYK